MTLWGSGMVMCSIAFLLSTGAKKRKERKGIQEKQKWGTGPVTYPIELENAL
jgi:hypothetical protein